MQTSQTYRISVYGLLIYLALFVLSACTSPGANLSTTSVEDLSLWDQTNESLWRTEGLGAVVGPGEETGFLVTRSSYENFRFTAEFWVEENTNSGIYVRCSDPSGNNEISPATCYEINIWDSHPDQSLRTGSVVNLAAPSVRLNTVGKWNNYEIVMVGTSITVLLNGVETVRASDNRLAAGFIALQYAGTGKILFRNVSIETL